MGRPGCWVDVADGGEFGADDHGSGVGGAVVGEGDGPGILGVGFEVRGVGSLVVALGVSVDVGEAALWCWCEGGVDGCPGSVGVLVVDGWVRVGEGGLS